jgi:hypothetical protein
VKNRAGSNRARRSHAASARAEAISAAREGAAVGLNARRARGQNGQPKKKLRMRNVSAAAKSKIVANPVGGGGASSGRAAAVNDLAGAVSVVSVRNRVNVQSRASVRSRVNDPNGASAREGGAMSAAVGVRDVSAKSGRKGKNERSSGHGRKDLSGQRKSVPNGSSLSLRHRCERSLRSQLP